MAKSKQKQKRQKDKQKKTNYWATRTPLKTGSEERCSGRVRSSYSTSGTSFTTFVLWKDMVASHEWGKGETVITTKGTYPW
jgi:hypothetical protein